MNRKLFVSLVVTILSINASAQLKYQDGRVLIDAIQSLKEEVELLKKGQ